MSKSVFDGDDVSWFLPKIRHLELYVIFLPEDKVLQLILREIPMM